VRKELHTKWCTENDFMSFFVSAKTGDSVQASFIRLAGVLAQVTVPKTAIEGMSVCALKHTNFLESSKSRDC
jgi:hypothetical protein